MSNQSNNNTSITENNQGYIDADREQPIANEHNSTASAGIPIIANGAKCTCTGASDPSAQVGIVALSQAIVRVNEGSLLAATTNDMTVDAVNFGTCKITSSACTANIRWENAYADTQILGSLQILTMNSTGMCRIGGKIEFTTCGQSERVTPITTEDIIGLENQQLSEENIATSSEEIYSEVHSIPDFDPLANLNNTVQELLGGPIIEVLEDGIVGNDVVAAITPVTYPQSKLGGTVKQPKNLPCTFKGAASGTYHWKIRDESMSVLKEANGAGQITIRFPKKGRYVIEAYQTDSSVKEDTTITDIDTKSDKFINALIVNVVDNELVLKANQTECITGGSVTIAVEKLFNTLDIDAGQISYRVLSQGIPLADSTQAQVSGNSNTATAKFDTKGSYVISGTSSQGIRINPTESIKVKNLSVKEVTAKGEKQYKARKGETFELKAVLKSNDTPENQQKVKWEVYYSETENGNKTKCYPIVGGAILNNKPPVSLFTQAGFYFIYAFCATSKTESVKAVVEICEPKFVSTVWKDLNGNNIQEIGKREAVYANIKMKGVSGLSLKFEVYCLQTNKLIEEMSISQIQSNKAIYKFQLSDNAIKELQNGNKLYIKPIVRNNNIVLANEDKAPSDYPITYITKKSITSINIYSDKDCKQTLSVGTIGKTIYARVLTRNLSEPNLNIGIFRKLDASFNVSDIILFIDNQQVKEDGSVVFEIVTKKGWQSTAKDNYLIYAMETAKDTAEYSALLELFLSNRASAQLKINQNVTFLSLTNNATNTVGQNKTITTVNQVANAQYTPIGKCYCNRDFKVDEVKSLVKAIKGTETIWEGGRGIDGFEACQIEDKTFEGLTKELNKAFRKHGINKCIQKIAILAETSVETGFFTCSEELKSRYASSKYLYKGRGMIQLTGSKDDNGNDIPGAYKTYKIKNSIQEDIVTSPNLVSEKLHLAIDSGCWYFSKYKTCPSWKHPTTKGKNESEEQLRKRQYAYKWKRQYFGEAVSETMTLSQIAKLMEQDEEKYFFLISKLCHGYGVYETNEKPASLNYEKRWNNFRKLKTWFKYDKNVCNIGETQTVVNTLGMPPWMEIAWQEYNTYKNYSHKESPLKERISEYFKNTVWKTGTYNDNWCAAFVTWCLNKGRINYTAPSGYGEVRARAFGKFGLASDHYWENGKVADRYGYGAIAQVKWVLGGEHVAFIIGKTTDGRIALLGGNQSKVVNEVKVGRSITKSSASASEIVCVMYPKIYEIDQKLYDLSSENITDKLTSGNTRR